MLTLKKHIFSYIIHIQIEKSSINIMRYKAKYRWQTGRNLHNLVVVGVAKEISYYNSSSVCLCVCLCVPYLLRGPLADLRQTWWVYVGGPPICP